MSTINSSDVVRDFPPLPHFQAGDVGAMWEYLKPGLDLIMSDSPVSHPYYMAMYSCVYNYCTSSSSSRLRSSGQTAHAHLAGGDLYQHLEAYFAAHVAAIPPLPAEALEGDETLLRAYAEVFAAFSRGAKYVDRLCTFLNRHWIKRERDEGAEAYNVYSLALKTWQDDYLPACQAQNQRITSALVQLIIEARDGTGEPDPTLFQAVAASLVEVSSESGTVFADPLKKSTRKPGPPRTPRTVYKTQLLDPLLASTRAYYEKRAGAYLADQTLRDYVVRAEEWLKVEEGICDAYLHGNRRTVGTAEDVLIRSRFDVLETEADRLLGLAPVDAWKDLAPLVTLVARLSKEPGVSQGVVADWTNLAAGHQTEGEEPTSLKQRTLDLFAACFPQVDEQ